jgi:hypothetical protein
LETFNIFPTNGEVASFWSIAYQAIYQVNTLLDKTAVYRENHPGMSDEDHTLLTRYENEAKWIRGLYYFHLAYLWGDAPLFIHAEKPADIYKPRENVNMIWQQVIDDFTAATALPERSEYSVEDLGRVTSGAAWAMLGRTHWFRRNFTEAKKALDILVEGEQKTEYVLDPDFATQWLNHNSNVKESIFEIQYKSNGKDWNMATGWNGVWFIPNCDGGYGMHVPTQQLFDDFDPEDPRITWTFIKQGDQFEGNPHTITQTSWPLRYFDRKHFAPLSEMLSAASPVYPQDLSMTNYIIRYADVLLMYAECCLETADNTSARKYLNQVRQRARQSNPLDSKRIIQKIIPNTQSTSLPDIITGNTDLIRQAIWRERRCELACEGLRRMDLVQQQRYGQVMTDYYKNKTIAKENPDKGRFYSKERELFPIPQGDIDLSKGALEQNKGY